MQAIIQINGENRDATRFSCIDLYIDSKMQAAIRSLYFVSLNNEYIYIGFDCWIDFTFGTARKFIEIYDYL